MSGELLLEVLELDVEISFGLHVAGADGVELRLERRDGGDILARRIVRKGQSE